MSSTAYQIVEGRYLEDILDQPRAVTATLKKLAIPAGLSELRQTLQEGKRKRLVLTGMGASLHALYPVYLRLIASGYNAVVVETAELVHYLPRLIGDESVIVAVSQSGESAETVRLLEMNAGRAPLIGITNTAESRLATRATAAIQTDAGAEFSVSCKTYIATHLALNLLGTFLCGEDVDAARREMDQVAPAISEYVTSWREHVLKMVDELEGVQQIFLTGRGPSLASATAGGLFFKESVRFRSEGMSGAAFRHGPFEALNRETFAVVFAGDESTRELQASLLRDIRDAGARGQWIGDSDTPKEWSIPKTSKNLRPIFEVLPVQMMTLALAAQRGIEAGRFARVSKVTTTE